MKHALNISTVLLSISLLGSLSFQAPALAECDCPCKENTSATPPHAFLATQGPGKLAQVQLTQSDKTVVQAYIHEQLKLNNITAEQFAALTPEQQKMVLMPGKQLMLTREARRAIVPKKVTVPAKVSAQLTTKNTVKANILKEYAIRLPASIESGMQPIPKGFQRVVIGDHLVILDGANTVVAVTKGIL